MAACDHLAEEVGVGAARVLGRELDVVGVLARLPDRRARPGQHVLAGGPELLLDMEVRRRDEDVDPAPRRGPQRLAGELDVALVAPRQRGDDRPADLVGDLLDAPEVAVGRGGEARLHDVHPERVELPGESQLLLGRETVAGSLLAVAQGRVEDQDVGDRHTGAELVDEGENEKRRGPFGPRRRCILSRRCYCLTLLVSARRGPLAHQ